MSKEDRERILMLLRLLKRHLRSTIESHTYKGRVLPEERPMVGDLRHQLKLTNDTIQKLKVIA